MPYGQPHPSRASLLIAALSLVVSLFALYESHEARISSVKDSITLLASRYTEDYPLVLHNDEGSLPPGDIDVFWTILISNTGNSTISLTRYEANWSGRRVNYSYFRALDKGIYSYEKRMPINLPITLEAGKSIKLLLKVNLVTSERAYKILQTAIKKEKVLMLHTAEKLLSDDKIELFDNITIPSSNEEKTIGLDDKKNSFKQVFWVSFKTARGVEVGKFTSWDDYESIQ